MHHLDNVHQAWSEASIVQVVGRSVLRPMHDDSRLEQIAQIVPQAQAIRR